MYPTIKHWLYLLSLIILPCYALPPDSLLQQLGWVKDNQRCQGHFKPLNTLPTHPVITLSSEKPVNFTDNQAYFEQATLTGPNSQLRASHLQLLDGYKKVWGQGGVALQWKQNLLLAQSAHWTPHQANLADVTYRMALKKKQVTAWGNAKTIDKNQQIWTLHHTTYSTCAITQPSWFIQANTVTLDQQRHWGTLKSAWLYWSHIPVFYWPYLRFPLDDQRHTGLLYPKISHYHNQGNTLSLPWYFAIATNQEATITPHFSQKNNLFFSGQWRYLGKYSQGEINGLWHPNDQAFARFKQTQNQPIKQSNHRWWVHINQAIHPSQSSDLGLTIDRHSDAFVIDDFMQVPNPLDPFHDQLSGHVSWHQPTWSSTLVWQQLTEQNRQDIAWPHTRYQPKPEWQTHWSKTFAHWGRFSLDQRLGYYQHPTQSISRIVLSPSWQLTQQWQGIALQEKVTSVWRHYSHTTLSPWLTSLTLRADLFHPHSYQTIYYHYTPYQSTQPPRLHPSTPYTPLGSLLTTNRFSDYDRLGDANEISWYIHRYPHHIGSLTLREGLGVTYALTPHRLCVTPTCQMDALAHQPFSPIEFSETIDHRHWHFLATLGISRSQYNHLQLIVNHHGPHHQFDLNYHHLGSNHEQDMISAELSKQLTPRWQWKIRSEYQQKQLGYATSLGYQSCCWNLHIGIDSSYNRENTARDSRRTQVFLQLSLRGLGHFGHLPSQFGETS